MNENYEKGIILEEKVWNSKWLANHPFLKNIQINRASQNQEGFDGFGDDGKKKYLIQIKSGENNIDIKKFKDLLLENKYNEHIGILIIITNNKKINKKTQKWLDKSSERIKHFCISETKLEDKKLIDNKILWPHQKDAIEQAKKHYENNDRGILEMACGTGKTLTAKHIMKELLPQGGLVFYFVPWLLLLEQSINKFDDKDILSIAVCSQEVKIRQKVKTSIIPFEHWLEKEILDKKLKENKYVVIFCTYDSYQRLVEQQKKHKLEMADLMICDEAHHMVYTHKIESKEITIHDEIKHKKALFMTATVKVYTEKKYNNFLLYDMNNQNIFGDKFFSFSFRKAIDEKILCPYEFNYNYITYDKKEAEEISEKTNFKTLPKYLDKKTEKDFFKKNFSNDSEYQKKLQEYKNTTHLNYFMRFIALYKNMKKIYIENIKINPLYNQSAIAFVNSAKGVKRSQEMCEYAEKIFNFLNQKETNYELTTDYISSEMSPQDRQEKLDKLISKKPFLLWNCRCLIEGVDIPKCDIAIFFDLKKSEIDIIQSVGRILRKDNSNQHKKAIIILPFNFDNDNRLDIHDISPKNKEFLNLIESILNSMGVEIKHYITKMTEINTYLEGDKEQEHGPFFNDPKMIEYMYFRSNSRFISTEKSWLESIVFRFQELLKLFEKEILKSDNSDNILKEMLKDISEILNISENHLDNEKILKILSQYKIVCTLLERISKVKFTLLKDYFDKKINKFIISEKLLNQIEYLIKQVIKFLDDPKYQEKYQNKSRDDFFISFYNRLILKIYPKLPSENGVYYTPKWIVKSLWDILIHVGKLDFNNNNYHIIDPASGIASFTAHFLKHVLKDSSKKIKYYNELIHVREINFLSYIISGFHLAIAAEQKKFIKNIHWGDTLKNESKSNNSISKQHQGYKDFTIVITNPPWSKDGIKKYYASKKDHHKEEYLVDQKIKETFIKNTNKNNKNALYNMYRRFVRWGLDHIQNQGWLAMVLPNSFLKENVEGFRVSLTEECEKIYLINLKGAGGIRTSNREIEGDNIFKTEFQKGNTQGTCLLLCYKNNNIKNNNTTYYAEINQPAMTNAQKKDYLEENYQNKNFFQIITLDSENRWFDSSEKKPKEWPSLCVKDCTKDFPLNDHNNVYFNDRNDGISTSCDDFLYDDNIENLKIKMKKFIDIYNESRLKKEIIKNSNIQWHKKLEEKCLKNIVITFDENKIKKSFKKPFDQKFLYFDPLIIDSPHKQDKHYNKDNISLCVSYAQNNFECLLVDKIPSKSLLYSTTCYPLSELNLQKTYNSKEWMAILYALLHHYKYRQTATNFLKNHYPTVPHLTPQIKKSLLEQGLKLMEIHLNYDQLKPSQFLTEIEFQKLDSHSKAKFARFKMMPYVPKEALEYTLFNKPVLYNLRFSNIFGQLVTMAIETTKIRKNIDKIVLNL